MYLRAKYTKYKMAKTKFSIWRYVICEICKKNGSNRPFLASRVADTIFPPPYRRSPPPTRQSMQRPNGQNQRFSSWAINYRNSIGLRHRADYLDIQMPFECQKSRKPLTDGNNDVLQKGFWVSHHHHFRISFRI